MTTCVSQEVEAAWDMCCQGERAGAALGWFGQSAAAAQAHSLGWPAGRPIRVILPIGV